MPMAARPGVVRQQRVLEGVDTLVRECEVVIEGWDIRGGALSGDERRKLVDNWMTQSWDVLCLDGDFLPFRTWSLIRPSGGS